MSRMSVVALALLCLLASSLSAEQNSAGQLAPTAQQPSFTPRPKMLLFKVLGIFDRGAVPVTVLYERPENIGIASFIRSGAGQTEPLAIDSLANQSDSLLVGKEHQVFGRFGDGTAVYLTPFSVMEITERKQTGDKGIDTLLSLFQGALRVNIPTGAAMGLFMVRLPNVKEGPIDVTGPAGSHFFLFPDPLSLNTEWRTIDIVLHVWAGSVKAALPATKEKTGDIVVTLDKGTTKEIKQGQALRMTFRYEQLPDPKYGGPVYMLFLDVVEITDLPPPRIVPRDLPPPPPPPPVVSGGGQ